MLKAAYCTPGCRWMDTQLRTVTAWLYRHYGLGDTAQSCGQLETDKLQIIIFTYVKLENNVTKALTKKKKPWEKLKFVYSVPIYTTEQLIEQINLTYKEIMKNKNKVKAYSVLKRAKMRIVNFFFFNELK